MTETLSAKIMVKKDGETKKGDPSVQLRFNELEYPIWAFKWAVKKVEKYEVGDAITLTYDDIDKTGEKPFLVIKEVDKGGQPSGAGGGTRKASGGSARTSGDNSRDCMMAFSYMKDLHGQYLQAGTKDPVKDAIKAGASLYEGAKNIVNPPQTPPENTKKASAAQEGRIRTMVDTIGSDTEGESWKEFIKKRYGTPLSHKNANHLIEMLQKTIDGKMMVKWLPNEEILFYDPSEKPVTETVTSE